MATIREIAKISGVSASTASRVLAGGTARSLCNERTAAQVEQVARQLGYRANYHMRSMRTGRSFAIGFSMNFSRQERAGYIGAWYFNQICEGVVAAAQEEGMNLMIVRPDARRSAWDRGVDYLSDRRLDALIVTRADAAASMGHPGPRSNVEALNIVTVDGCEGAGFPHAGFDEPFGLSLVARHLRDLGHERVIWFGPTVEYSGSSVSREQAFLREAFAVGLAGRVCLVPDIADRGKSPFDAALDNGQAGLATYLRDGDLGSFTAVVCYNDLYAIAAQRALATAGRHAPADVSVVGFDDSWAAFGQPPLTTVSHQLFEMGELAGRLAIQMLEHREKADKNFSPPDKSPSFLVKPHLVIRQSTGPVAAAS